jgi:hypothetical protein
MGATWDTSEATMRAIFRSPKIWENTTKRFERMTRKP